MISIRQYKKYFDILLPITNDSKKLIEYLMKQSDEERLRVFYMDEKHYLLQKKYMKFSK
ncbi:MAG: hypothetical protein ACR5K2_03895 [Wolbachia sp.]